jgi:hypothetical protein
MFFYFKLSRRRVGRMFSKTFSFISAKLYPKTILLSLSELCFYKKKLKGDSLVFKIIPISSSVIRVGLIVPASIDLKPFSYV